MYVYKVIKVKCPIHLIEQAIKLVKAGTWPFKPQECKHLISPYDITSWLNNTGHKTRNGLMFNQILPTSTCSIRSIWRIVRRICMWILGLKGLTLVSVTWSDKEHHNSAPSPLDGMLVHRRVPPSAFPLGFLNS